MSLTQQYEENIDRYFAILSELTTLRKKRPFNRDVWLIEKKEKQLKEVSIVSKEIERKLTEKKNGFRFLKE